MAVRSSIAERYHLTARQACTCPDFERRARGERHRGSRARSGSVRSELLAVRPWSTANQYAAGSTAFGGSELSSRFSPAGGALTLRTSPPGQDQRLEQRAPERKHSV